MPLPDSPKTIVIVGGGSIGLCNAYNLAKSFSTASSEQVRIIVIDIFEKPFAASSSQCTGCIHYGFPEKESEPLLPLGKYSFDLWAAEAESEEFRNTTGYRAHSFFGVRSGSGNGIGLLPDWIQRQPDWDIDEDILGPNNATVNPSGVGTWLTAQCLKLGVQIETGMKAIYANLSPENQVQSVVCSQKDQGPVWINCSQLLLACGPWTPKVYKKLFPFSPVRLHASTSAGDWIICKNPCPTTAESVAYVSFGPLIGEKLEFAARNDGTIWACGRKNLTASLPFPGQTAEPDEELIEDLLARAHAWLSSHCSCSDKHNHELQLLDKGRAFRPATKSGLPVLSEVESSDLTGDPMGRVQETSESTSTSGVYICWGHGSYGLTLGMGTGKLMDQLMRGEEPDLDLSLFALSNEADKETHSS